MNYEIRKLLIVAICLVSFHNVTNAFPSAKAHFDGIGNWGGYVDIMGTPVKQGGLGKVAFDKVMRASKWIDNPATKTGQYLNQKAGGTLVTPMNHGSLRHNPGKIENALKWQGSKNLGRLHKIQDVVYNSARANVDGYKITSKMRKEADVILRYVRRYKKLPKRLPSWVDRTATSLRTTSPFRKVSMPKNMFTSPLFKSTLRDGGKVMRVVGKVAIPIAVTTELALVLYTAHQIEGILEMSSGDMERCGFSKAEIKGNVLAWKNIKTFIKAPVYRLEMGIDYINKLTEYRMNAEFYSEILK